MPKEKANPTLVSLGHGEDVIYYDDRSERYTRGHIDLEAFAEKHNLPLVDVRGSVERGDLALLPLLVKGPLLDATCYAPDRPDYGPYDYAPIAVHLALCELAGVRVVWRKAEPYRAKAFEVARRIFERIFPGELEKSGKAA